VSIPNLERTGGLAWTRRSRGKLSSRERRRLLGEIVRAQGSYLAGRIKLASGRVPAGARDLAADALRPPDSGFARAAEEACREQTQSLIGHGYRTWMFGSGLAALDGDEPDPELFYVACLLHDYGLDEAVPGEDFTLRSADRLERCGKDVEAPATAVTSAADAITVHTTPGIRVETDGALGVYVQAGAMLDLAGLRAEDLTSGYREHTIREHPRDGVTAEVVAMIRSEARANPGGRFGILRRCGLLTLVKMNPLRPK
jgi:hypothetical protein